MNRRSVLQAMGVTAGVSLAGCSSNQNGSGNGTNGSSNGGGKFSSSEINPQLRGRMLLRDVIDDEILIFGIEDGREVVHYAGKTYPPVDGIDGDFVPTDKGVAYKAFDRVEVEGRSSTKANIGTSQPI